VTKNPSVPVNRSLIGNGVEVISTETARGVIMPGRPETEVSTVEKVLDANGDEWFRCRMSPEKCAYFRDNLKSILAHQRTHSPALAAKRAEAELAAARAKKNAEFQRRSNGMVSANEAKRKRHEAEVTSDDKRVADVQRKLSDMAVAVEKIAATIPPLAEILRVINTELGEITLQVAETDPEILRKAQSYDALKGILNN
jgi:hypothetical protein